MKQNVKRALICDDETKIFEKIEGYLKSKDIVVEERVDDYYSLHKKLTEAKENMYRYQLVLIDVSLELSGGNENGIQIYNQISEEFPDQHYIIYTRQDTEEIRSQITRLYYKRNVDIVLLSNDFDQREIGWAIERSLPRKTDTVFLVYGRNRKKNTSIKNMLTNNFGLKVMSFHDAKIMTKGNKVIFDIFMTATTKTYASIILFTDDEEVELRKEYVEEDDYENSKSKEKKRRQSRPNVYVEAGFLMGTKPFTTAIVDWPDDKESFSRPSDFDGMYYYKFDDTIQKREEIKNWLEYIGCNLKLHPNWKNMPI